MRISTLPPYNKLLHLLSLISIARGGPSENGIIGFGISMYPDLCCQACHGSLSSLYLNCTTFDVEDDDTDAGMGGMMKRHEDGDMVMGTTSDDCRATNKQWLQTMAYCIQQNCNADGYPADKQAECFSSYAVGGASEPIFEESLPAEAPIAELADDAMWLNETSLVNGNMYYVTHGTLSEFVRSEEYHTKYAVALILLVIGSCLAYGIFAQIRSRLSPNSFHKNPLRSKLQQHLLLPALLGQSSRRLQPLPGKLGYIPGRALSISIAIYIILNIIFSAVSFRSFQPNIWFLSKEFELCEYVGNRTGTLSLVNISIAILFAGRNNILIALTGWNQTTFLTLHRWIARVATVQVVVHSIVYTLAYFEPGYEGASAYAAMAAEPFYWWGIIGTIALCLVITFALLPFRSRFYEPFLLTHIILVILSLVATWYHLVPHFGYKFGYQTWLYISFAFWAGDRFIRLVRVILYNHFPGSGSEAIVQAVPGSNGMLIEITIFPRVTWGFGRPGQHSFLSFPGMIKGTGRFWESHPFSVAGWDIPGQQLAQPQRGEVKTANTPTMDKEPDKEIETTVLHHNREQTPQPLPATPQTTSIKFLIRSHTGITSLLSKRLLSTRDQKLALKIYTEGPYAGHRATLYPIYFADTIVCIAGGIGITHILGFVQGYVHSLRQTQTQTEVGIKTSGRNAMRAKRFILAWSAREMALIRYVKENFLAGVGRGVEVEVWCTGGEDRSAGGGGFVEGEKLERGGEGLDHIEGAEGDTEAGGKAGEARVDGGVQTGRMDIASVLSGAVEVGQRTAVMVCAPGALADEVTRETVKCVGDGFGVDLVEETFAW